MKQLVLPGELLGEKLRAGEFTYREGESIYSAILGLKMVKNERVTVIPLGGIYNPLAGEHVIGNIIDISASMWMVDIHAPYPALLHATEVPWRVPLGETDKYLRPGETLYLKVLSVNETKRIQVTMKDHASRKLHGGFVLTIAPSRVPRVIGREGSMITLLKNRSKCRILVGQNGRIWLDGERIDMVVKAIRKIEKKAHTEGLTDTVNEYLKELMC